MYMAFQIAASHTIGVSWRAAPSSPHHPEDLPTSILAAPRRVDGPGRGPQQCGGRAHQARRRRQEQASFQVWRLPSSPRAFAGGRVPVHGALHDTRFHISVVRALVLSMYCLWTHIVWISCRLSGSLFLCCPRSLRHPVNIRKITL